MSKNVMQKIAGNFYHRGLQLLFMGCVTGFLAGVLVTFYNVLSSIGEGFATGIYDYLRVNWWLIPLLFAVLAGVAFVVGVIVKFIPMVRGSGIPQTEGLARGALKYNWFASLCTMFAASLACIFLGLSAGSEGPGIYIGGACGYGSSRLFSKTDMLRRYQVTGGACAGLAVAFNAPLTGMAFAFEETHKKFSPEVFICAFSSVVTGVITRNLIRTGLGLSTGAVFDNFVFHDLPYENYGFLLLAALVCALLGVGFYYAVIYLKKLVDSKLTFFKNTGKMLIPFLLAGVMGLLCVYAVGGGHALIDCLATVGGTKDMEITSVLGMGIAGTLLLALVCKLLGTILNMSFGVPCGVFIPMLAVGAALGGLLCIFFTSVLGMDGAYCDLLIMICMAAFFTCVVRAPITAVIMVLELTWSFTALLPIVVGVAVGYMVGQIAGTKPIYEELLDQMIEEQKRTEQKKFISRELLIVADSIMDGLEIKDILFPVGVVVKTVTRGEDMESFTPTADTVLLAGDIISVEGEVLDEGDADRELTLLSGARMASR